jgi:hypothetical protein
MAKQIARMPKNADNLSGFDGGTAVTVMWFSLHSAVQTGEASAAESFLQKYFDYSIRNMVIIQRK